MPKPITCNYCDFKEICNLLDIDTTPLINLHQVSSFVVTVKKGQSLYKTNTPLKTLYVIRSGSLKLCHPSDHKIINFYFQGQLIGFEGIENNHHTLDAIAIEDSTLCAFDYNDLLTVFSRSIQANKDFIQILSKRFNQQTIQLDYYKPAHTRFAQFLLRLSTQQKHHGFSAYHFIFPMKRLDIANYLDLSVETISRLLHDFTNQELIHVDNKEITIIDLEKLKGIASN